MSLKENIDREKLPRHVAIIMDGNGRWAKLQGKNRIHGHKSGVTSVREVTEAAAELGIEYLTLYAFSTENWKRPPEEIDALMSLLVATLNSEIKTLVENNVRLKAIGDIDSLPGIVGEQLHNTIELTKNHTGMTLVLALSYSARWEITEAVKRIARETKNGNISLENIDPELFERHLTTRELPDPELLIRTSGEFRISNFLLWQIAYAELYFTSKLWPDFRKEDFYHAIVNYQCRERRFGKISEQINQR
jgi:undecaprenyl diphosphate synthase